MSGVLIALVVLLVESAIVVLLMSTKWGEALTLKSTRRELVRRNRKRRPTALSHLTDEQWRSHMEAFVDYQCKAGKYHNFTGLIREWLEREGLPPSPMLNTAEEKIRYAETA